MNENYNIITLYNLKNKYTFEKQKFTKLGDAICLIVLNKKLLKIPLLSY